MRFSFAFLLLCSLVLPASMNAQLSWSKHSYKVPGQAVKRADFTGDGYPDLLLYDGTNLSILPNAGNGTFDTSRLFSVKQQIRSVTLPDLDRDGKLDVAGCTDAGIVILTGNGNGTLTLWKTIPGTCSSLASADFNNDGNPDLVEVVSAGFNGVNHNQVIVYFGDGQGGFSSPVVNDNVDFVSSDGNPCVLSGTSLASDFTGDKVADIALTADCPNGVASASALLVGTGNGTGNFSFRKDQDLNYDAPMELWLGDANQDGRNDLIAVARGSGPHASGWGDLIVLNSHGDGTFDPAKAIISSSVYAGEGDTLGGATLVDLDGDGIQDAIGVVGTFDFNDNETFTLQFFKGKADGSFQPPTKSTLSSGAFDVLWGDYDKDGRADLALVRSIGNDTDVWLNTAALTNRCAAINADRSLGFCALNLQNGNYHFVGSPRDTRPINAMQIYVDGVVKFTTPNDLLDTNLQLSAGKHRITAKAWDDLGPFSSVINLTVASSCSNTTNRTVHICSPQNGATVTATNGQIEVAAAAATNLSFNSIQIYVDGTLAYHNTTKSIDTNISVATGAHRITVKGWDSNGAFSSSVNVSVQ